MKKLLLLMLISVSAALVAMDPAEELRELQNRFDLLQARHAVLRPGVVLPPATLPTPLPPRQPVLPSAATVPVVPIPPVGGPVGVPSVPVPVPAVVAPFNLQKPSLDAFATALNPIEFPYDNQIPPYGAMTADDMATVLTGVANMAKATMNDRKLWVPSSGTSKKNINLGLEVYGPNEAAYQPYVQKLLVPVGAEIIIFGDFHGSAHSFVRSLQQLKALGYLNDDFKLKPDTFIIFLGDAIDGGSYGLETLFVEALLKLKNFNNVFLIRGNHELTLNDHYHFVKYELAIRLGLTAAQKNIIKGFFNLSPLALFVGNGNEFVLCAHGGLEYGYNPTGLLSNPNKLYQRLDLDPLNRVQAAGAIDALTKKANIWPTQLTTNFVPNGKDKPHKIGFTWDIFDFAGVAAPYNKGTKYATNGHSGALVYDREMVRALLTYWNQLSNKFVLSIIRGHQHGPTNHPALWKSGGFLPLWDGLVYTLFAGPANYLPEYSSDYPTATNPAQWVFNFDTFAILKITAMPKTWEIEHWYRSLQAKYKDTKANPSTRWKGDAYQLLTAKSIGHTISI